MNSVALQQFLDSRDFYEYCQRYRWSKDDGTNAGASARFSELRAAILNAAQSTEFVSEYK